VTKKDKKLKGGNFKMSNMAWEILLVTLFLTIVVLGEKPPFSRIREALRGIKD